MTTPVISSASVVAGVLTVVGSNFDAKTAAAPFFYQDFTTADAVNDADLRAGYANQRAYGAGTYTSVTVDTSVGRTTGRGALKYISGPGDINRESFPHISVNASNTGLGNLLSDQLYASYWFKITRTVSGSSTQDGFQIKGPRAGYVVNYTDDHYASPEKYLPSFWPLPDVQSFGWTSTNWSNRVDPPFKQGDDFMVNTPYKATWQANGWNFVQVWYVFNTLGSANGFQKILINNSLITQANSSIETMDNCQPVIGIGQQFKFAMLFPGMDLPLDDASEYQMLFSEHYIDTTPQRVMLGNASTLAATTGGLLGVPSAWTALGITAATPNIPTGYNWVYVTNSANETNSSGFPLSAGTFQSAWARNSNQLIRTIQN